MAQVSPTRLERSVFTKGWNALNSGGLLGLLDSSLYVLLRNVRRTFYRWRTPSFGLMEAILWGKYVDKWQRYNAVLTHIDQLTKAEPAGNSISILEVGCGSEGLVEFNPCLNHDSYTVESMDVALAPAAKERKYPRQFSAPVAGDGCHLPFADASKDFVISIDSLEHVPESGREAYLRELVRVAGKAVLLTCPMQSCDGRFRGGEYDAFYQRWYTRKFGSPNVTITEHLEFGAPSVETLKKLLPEADILGVFNAETWFKCMTFSGIAMLGQLTGFWFLLFGTRKAGAPSYYGGLLYLKK